MSALQLPMYFSRWVSLVAGVYMMLLSGSIYMFAVYSSDLKQIFGYSTEEINLVGTLANTGAWTSILAGIWLDHLGPRSTSLVGGILNFSGYFLIHMAAKGYIGSGNVWMVGAFAGLMGQGGSWVSSAALKENASNFPSEDRGKVVGALLAFFGLSSGVLTQMYKGFYSPDVVDFLLFLAIALGSGPIVFGLFVNRVPDDADVAEYAPTTTCGRINRISFIYIIAIFLAIFISVSSSVTGALSLDALPFAIVMLCVLALIAVIPFTTGKLVFVRPTWRRDRDSSYDGEYITFLDKSSINLAKGDSTAGGSGVGNAAGMSVFKTMRQVDFWLLLFVFFAVIGAGITLVNNFAELVFSIADVDRHKVYRREDVPDFEAINTLVSLFSSFNTLGRMGGGLLSDYVGRRWAPHSRVSLLVATSALMGAVNLYLAFDVNVPMLYPGVIFLGLAYGATFCVVPTLVLEFFGIRYFATNFGVTGLAPAAGSELLGTLLAGKLNDYFSKDGQFSTVDKSGHLTAHCNNPRCYRYTLFITASLCAVSVLVSLWLWRRRQNNEKRSQIKFSSDGEEESSPSSNLP